MSINTMFADLQREKCASRLRNILFSFNEYMFIVIDGIDHALGTAGMYYVYGSEPIETIMTEGQMILDALEEAIPILKDHALPFLPETQKELEFYIRDYRERYHRSQRRSQSWVPFAVRTGSSMGEFRADHVGHL
ncbi:4799_t:CDS:2 [Acaulospora colombiana]|uniref:4799_t:CDS:1 n=1 Tax=Acaulospora colombiana TaxID=27376 RepID=A0ACA9MFS6_9GLOM|nr:4799_t:CDS:2 [Acaulospora colombiana]